jgi:AICAR transformylase/IMP cyclohydrolase PurH
MRDDQIIAAANEHNISMIFTSMRHFRQWWQGPSS